MKIKRFNESHSLQGIEDSDKIYAFIVMDNGGFIEEDESVAFHSMFDAVDYYIRWVNDSFDEDFEPMKDEDGTRFFTSVDENPDWEKCVEYAQENEINIELIQIPLL